MSADRLARFDPAKAKLLGEGGEAQVYALDEGHVVRLFHSGTTTEDVAARSVLLAEIAAGAAHLPFATPVVVAEGELLGRCYAIEKRLPGISMMAALSSAQGGTRRRLIARYMMAAWQLDRIAITRPFLGEFGRRDAIQTGSWSAYLAARAARSLAGSVFADIDAAPLAAALGPLAGPAAFVHLDYFAGNVLVAGDQITAVIDFGYSSILGDRRLNAVVAAAHLVTPRITPAVTADDQAIAMAWLRERDLLPYYQRGVPWLAAYWAFAADDPSLRAWCDSILRA